MIVIGIIVGCGIAAAVGAFALSASRKIEIDPVDPEVAERAVERSIRHHPKVRRFLEQRMDRTSAGGYLLTAAFALVFASTLVLGVLLVLIDDNRTVRDVDRRVSEWGSEHAGSRAVDVVEVVTNLGTTWVVFLVLAIVAVTDFVRRRNREVFWFVAAVGLGQNLINNLIKIIVRRDRPEVLQVMDAHGFSFPSGHTAAAAACWAAVALVLGRDRHRAVRAVLAGGAALVAVVVATSRALLGVHWVSDVLAGLALGWGWFLLVAIVFGGRKQRLGDPVVETAHQPHAIDATTTVGERVDA
jgi:membrane-associated phospholipid phosphatase